MDYWSVMVIVMKCRECWEEMVLIDPSCVRGLGEGKEVWECPKCKRKIIKGWAKPEILEEVRQLFISTTSTPTETAGETNV